MAKRPIYQANLYFNYYSSKTARPVIKKSKVTTFITTEDLNELNNDEMVIKRIMKSLKKTKDIKIKITQTEILNQYGYTTDRF